ncbi:MAG TPA: carboxypeptidase-like regulatory domain-containing protein [Terriglobales bacterium]|nr:carboxypeptidase-like regulatory domain-containing protein [Terriglobales bacterium]
MSSFVEIAKPARILLFTIFVVVGLLPSSAQQTTGTISGSVKDQQAALVSSAIVTAKNTSTGLGRSARANEYGEYRIEFLPVGTYTVEVSAPNFKKFVQVNVVLTVDQTQTVNITLTPGGPSETITVTEAPPLVNTSSVEIGRTISSAEIIELPLVNRNAYQELSLTPGVQFNSAGQFSNPSGTPNFQIGIPSTDVVINGGVDEGVPMVSYYLDGGINMSGARNYGNQLPNPDALEEFRAETNNYSAQYGRMGGGVVTAVTKSGTNQFHGSLFEFNRNTDFNAFPWNPQ